MAKQQQHDEHGDPKIIGKIEWLKVDDLTVDPTMNRPIDDKRAGRMASDFDLDALGVVTAARTEEGLNVLLDGQHRCEALRKMGWNGEKIPVNVFLGLSREQRARKMMTLNAQVRMNAVDRFIGRIAAKDKVACGVNEVVKANGYVIDRQSRDGVIVAVKALEDIFLGKNQKICGTNTRALHATLHAVTEAWGRSVHSVNREVLSGVGQFILRYGDHVKLDRMIDKLKSVSGGSVGLINRGRGKRELHGGSLASGIAHFITDEYNRGLHGKSRLPSWRLEEDAV
jgi:hypothetical protein